MRIKPHLRLHHFPRNYPRVWCITMHDARGLWHSGHHALISNAIYVARTWRNL